MPNHWIVTALGKDRPGIVAGVTKILYKHGCNLEDSAMTQLGGQFAVMLVFSAAAKHTEEKLRKAFGALEKELRLVVHLKPLSKMEATAPRKRGRTHIISVYGADKPGIVFQFAEVLTKAGVNIQDVHTHRSSSGGPTLYLLVLEVDVPQKQSIDALQQQLTRVGKRLGVELSLRASEAEFL